MALQHRQKKFIIVGILAVIGISSYIYINPKYERNRNLPVQVYAEDYQRAMPELPTMTSLSAQSDAKTTTSKYTPTTQKQVEMKPTLENHVETKSVLDNQLDTRQVPDNQMGAKPALINKVDATPVLQNQVNAKQVPAYDNPLLTHCMANPVKKLPSNAVQLSPELGAEDCRSMCRRQEESYALMLRGACSCSYLPKDHKIVNFEVCNATCHDDDPGCDLKTKPHGILMKTASYRDQGYIEWTVWMVNKELNVKVRYRSCQRSVDSQTDCRPDIERQAMSEPSATQAVPENAKEYLGCFTGMSLTPDLIKAERVLSQPTYHTDCRDLCMKAVASYAFLNATDGQHNTSRRCFCTNTLALSQPTESCAKNGFGYYVYSSAKTSSEYRLKFSPAAKKIGKVLVIARFRSGSSMTQSFFAKIPKSLAYFEPGKNMKFMKKLNSTYPADRAILKGMEALYSCNPDKVPNFLHNSVYLRWTEGMFKGRGQAENMAAPVLRCTRALPSGVSCLPYWVEACQRAEFINVKVNVVQTPDAIREFAKNNKDVHVLHLVRDPKGLIAAQKSMGVHWDYDAQCDEIASVGKVFHEMREAGYKNAHEVHYQQLAVDPSYYGAKLYQEIGVNMPAEVETFLSRDNITKSDIQKIDSAVVRADPNSSVYKFLRVLNVDVIKEIDSACREVYKTWPDLYHNLPTLYKLKQSDVLKYAPPAMMEKIRRYVSNTEGET